MGQGWTPRLALGLAALVLLATPWVHAADARHTSQAGDSLESLGRHFYGSSWKGAYIAGRNGLGEGPLPAGKSLTIPSTWTYKIKKGDSLAKLAKKYLGDTDRFVLLQTENNLPTPDVQIGVEIVMPFVLSHVVQNGDSLSALANRYYRNKKKAQLLSDFNRGADKLSPGQKILVPIFDKAALDPKGKGAPPKPSPAPAAAAASPSGPATSPTPPHAAADPGDGDRGDDGDEPEEMSEAATLRKLEGLVQAFENGEYESACQGIEAMLTLRAAAKERGLILRYLAFCAVAYDDLDAARDYFKKLLELDPKITLDPRSTSPRILAVFDDVRRDI